VKKELEVLKRTSAADVAAARDKLEELRRSSAAELEELRRSSAAELEKLRRSSAAELEEVKRSYAASAVTAAAAANSELEELKRSSAAAAATAAAELPALLPSLQTLPPTKSSSWSTSSRPKRRFSKRTSRSLD
jgi:hypothetical protein